uniref:AAA+ ATPase domain-containing protein n=1 Tax=Acyrthosiphon pisum TaxID=7029 RepID=A0A8R2B9Z2_ACYPI
MIRPDSRQGLTLLAAALAILLVVGFWGLSPLNTVALCVLVLLVAGFLLWHLQRNATDHQPDIDASLPPETYCGPVILVIGDTAPLFGDLTHRETRLGWYLNVRQPAELPALAERLAQQYSALLPQLSVMLAIIPGQHTSADALSRFTRDVTADARDGKIDPVYGRDNEIRQIVDILSRRRKNNPILVGEPGVGKTALVEGLALRIAEGNVPASLSTVSVRTLDLGMLQAGAGVKGEFEQRLKNIITEVQQAEQPVLLFIDEAHTIIGAGNQAGGADAANLLKPALARGELRTIAATTWSEYKQYFEKDAALERRFQMVKVDEPDDETACLMLRGLKSRYAQHHGVHITDEAVRAAVTLSRRYLTGRQLPDKAVDLLDTASARVRMSQDTVPEAITQL